MTGQNLSFLCDLRLNEASLPEIGMLPPYSDVLSFTLLTFPVALSPPQLPFYLNSLLILLALFYSIFLSLSLITMQFSVVSLVATPTSVVTQTSGFDAISTPTQDQTIKAGSAFEIVWEPAVKRVTSPSSSSEAHLLLASS